MGGFLLFGKVVSSGRVTLLEQFCSLLEKDSEIFRRTVINI